MSSIIKLGVFESKPYDVEMFEKQTYKGSFQIQVHHIAHRLDESTVEKFTEGLNAICCFVNSDVNKTVLQVLKKKNINVVLLRCAGFDNVDLEAAKELGISVARVPVYSPYAVAEYAASLLMTLNRKVNKAYNRTRNCDYTLSGLVGTDLYGKTMGVVGTGKIGCCFINIALGFGCKILAFDVYQNPELKKNPNVTYVTLEELFSKSDFISLHAPLTKETTHLINEKALSLMKKHCIIVNTSRGKLVDSNALLYALDNKIIAGAGLDVYENEKK
jgi:D-lactate dehydrogenase